MYSPIFRAYCVVIFLCNSIMIYFKRFFFQDVTALKKLVLHNPVSTLYIHFMLLDVITDSKLAKLGATL